MTELDYYGPPLAELLPESGKMPTTGGVSYDTNDAHVVHLNADQLDPNDPFTVEKALEKAGYVRPSKPSKMFVVSANLEPPADQKNSVNLGLMD